MIDPAACYTRKAFLTIVGWSTDTLARAEREGLKIIRPGRGRTQFVMGRDFINWLTTNDAQKDSGSNRLPA